MVILNKFLRIPVIGRKIIYPFIIKREGGVKTSQLARQYARNRSVDIGMYTYGGCFDEAFNVGGSVIIGRYCSFASNCHYYGANHPINKAVMSPYFYNKTFGFDVRDVERNTLNIGNDVWVGSNVIITSSCHSIGDGAVLGAGSIVTKDVPPYAIITGNPGRIKKYRFDNLVIEKLLQSQWWELTPEELIRFYDSMDDPLKFAENVISSKQK